MNETILNTRSAFSGKLIHVDLLETRLPDGNIGQRELVRHPGAVAIVALDADENVLLVRQYRIGAEQSLLEIPAGTLEAGEDPAICADRELQEEASYKPGTLEALGGFYVAPGYTTEYIHLFLARDLTEASLDADDDEFISVEIMPLDSALNLIDRGEIIDGKTINGLLRVARHLKQG